MLIVDAMRELELKIIESFIRLLESYEVGNPKPYKDLKFAIETFEMNLLSPQQYYELIWDNL